MRIRIAILSALLLFPVSAHSQNMVSINVGGGLGLPVGDGLDNAKMGPAIVAGVSLDLNESAAIVLEGQYSQYSPDDDAGIPTGVDATVKLTGANVGARLQTSSESPARAYLHVGIGLTRGTGQASGSFGGVNVDVSDSENSFSFLVGIGMKYAVTETVSLMVDTRYNHALDHFDSSTQWIPITAGLSFTIPK